MLEKGFSNPRSHWFSNLGFQSEPVLLGQNVTDVFDSSFYSDPLWTFVHCCQGEEWSSADTQWNVSVQHHNRQNHPAASFSRWVWKLFTLRYFPSLVVTNDMDVICHSSKKWKGSNGNGGWPQGTERCLPRWENQLCLCLLRIFQDVGQILDEDWAGIKIRWCENDHRTCRSSAHEQI